MRGRPALTAAFSVVVLALGQLAAVAHAAAARHVTCGAHGEDIEAPILEGTIDRCEETHFVGVEGDVGEHEDCALARVLRQTSDASRSAPAIGVATFVATAAAPPATRIGATLDLVLIAPKTSPPR